MGGIVAAAALLLVPPVGSQGAAPSAATFSITGRVVTSDGVVYPTLSVSIFHPTGSGVSGTGCEMTRDGRFRANGLGPGTYILEAAPEIDGPDDHPVGFERGFTTVTVTDSDVHDVVITTAPGVTVTGRVTFEGNVADSPLPPHIVVNLALAVTEWTGPMQSAVVGPDGTFELPDVRGPRIFRLGWQLPSASSRWGPGRVLLDGRDITNVPVEFERIPSGDLEIVFTDQRSAIVGRVEDVAGLAVPGACAVLLPQDSVLRHGWSTAVGTTTADHRGRFHFSSVPEGDYFVSAFTGSSCPSPAEAVGRAGELTRSAVSVSIATGATAMVQVSAQPALPKR